MAAMSNYLENKVIDAIFRGQAFPTIANIYIGLFTVTPSDAGGGTEVVGNNYGRATVAATLALWAGTQSAGSTTASSGTGGTTSNNGVVTFAVPSASWGTVVAFGLFDAISGGNLLFWGALSANKLIQSGDAVSIQIAQLQVQIDD